MSRSRFRWCASSRRCARYWRRPGTRNPRRKRATMERRKAPRRNRGKTAPTALFDLRFLELDVLARHRVVLPEGHLLGDVPRVLLGHVIEARIGGADELDLDRGR